MAGHTFFGKQKLCYTEVSDFTDYQGIGHDPLYKRYDSVFSIVKKTVPANLHHFLATPEYLDDEDQICWHVDNWNERPIRLTDLSGTEYDRYKSILEDTVRKYKSSIMKLNGEDLQIMAGAIKYVDDNCVYCGDGKVFLVAWGMTIDTRQHKVIGSVIHDFEYVKTYQISFDAGDYGNISKFDKSMKRVEGATLSNADIPELTVMDGWKFIGWDPSPLGQIVTSDMRFTAKYEQEVTPVTPSEPLIPPPPHYFYCKFDAGEYGKIEGASDVRKEANTRLMNEEIPSVTPNKGYTFKGWNISPTDMLVDEDKVFTAQYEKRMPWYLRFWHWLTSLFVGKGCLKWLLYFLLGILLFSLLSWLLRGCIGCSGLHSSVNGVVPMDSITRSDGRVIDNNGFSHPLTGDDGVLPDEENHVAPILGEDGSEIPIVKQPGVPNTIANRLFLFMENENDNIESLAQDFKKAYPGDQYSIIGYDKEVKLLVIQVPENEREQIRQTINNKIPNHKFLVFDEEIYEIKGKVSTQSVNRGWHIKAINLQAGWAITKGSPKVKVAIVDDGIESSHPMFKGRIVDAYNVYTQDNRLSVGDGHGTHTAGLAVGCTDYINEGAAGIAPNCMLMPIQVFDNKLCPLSALIAGVMYAIHHNADVVNLSVSPSFEGLDMLPPEQQEQIAHSQFKNVEKLWARVCTLASKKKCILVFAAGNDNILSSIPPENRNMSSIVVTAVDHNLYPTNFTNYGPCSDISAPGKDIYSAFPRGSFQSFDGTSMAAPIVTGTIALMKSLKKDLTVTQVRNVLYKTGADVYGYIPPMILVDKALAAVKRGDFSESGKRKIRPVPGGAGEDSFARRGEEIKEPPAQKAPPQNADETDYDAIRRQINEYKKKINELEKLLQKK